jgi:hypothetical protein
VADACTHQSARDGGATIIIDPARDIADLMRPYLTSARAPETKSPIRRFISSASDRIRNHDARPCRASWFQASWPDFQREASYRPTLERTKTWFGEP